MSKSLQSMQPYERQKAVERRIREVSKDQKTKKPVGGLGYWAAVDYINRLYQQD